jgi:hypothetical protein
MLPEKMLQIPHWQSVPARRGQQVGQRAVTMPVFTALIPVPLPGTGRTNPALAIETSQTRQI